MAVGEAWKQAFRPEAHDPHLIAGPRGERNMTRKLYLGMAALVVFGMVTAAQAVEPVHVADVEQVSTINISTQFASMQAELDSLRAQIQPQ